MNIRRASFIARLVILVLVGSYPIASLADGQDDLRSALKRLQGSTAVSGVITAKVVDAHGPRDKTKKQTSELSARAEDGPSGLKISYDRETASRLDADSLKKELDPKAQLDALPAATAFGYQDVRDMSSAGPALSRILEGGEFESESKGNWNGAPARVLKYSMGLPSILNDTQRSYVKDHTGTLEVWIATDGTPLGSLWKDTTKGRAFMVLSLQFVNEQKYSYAVVGDRLVATARYFRRVIGQGDDVQERTINATSQLSKNIQS
ncbi:MAG: hypothetical protein V4607_07865 [Pseudomonadota bacterium]